MNKHLVEKKNIRRANRDLRKNYLAGLRNVERRISIFTGKPELLKFYLRDIRMARCIIAYNRAHGRNYDRAKRLVNRHYDCFGMFVTDITTARHFRKSGWACPSPDFVVR